MSGVLEMPEADSGWIPGGRFGLLSRDEYLAVTRLLLNTIRETAPRWIPADDARLWRTWIGLVESTDLEPERPVGPPRQVLMQLWAATHLALLAGSLRLPVGLDVGRVGPVGHVGPVGPVGHVGHVGPVGLVGRVEWRLDRAERYRLATLAGEVWSWYAAQAARLGVPFVTFDCPLPFDADQSGFGPVPDVLYHMAAEDKRLQLVPTHHCRPLPDALHREIWHLHQATGWDAKRLAQRFGLRPERVAVALWTASRQPPETVPG